MNRAKLALVALVACIFMAGEKGQCEFLQGRIEHSDTVAPVEQEFRPGARLAPQVFKEDASASGNSWYEIPFWLAGTWHQDVSTQIRVYKYQTGESETPMKSRRDSVTRTYGDQMDDHGRIWSFDNCPFVVAGNYEDKDTHSIFRSFVPVEITSDSVTFRSLQLSVLSDPHTQTVLATTVKESITKFERMGKDRCSTISSVKVFDVNGNPLELYDVKSTRVRTQPFSVRDSDDGRNLQEMFVRFMARRHSAS